MCLQKSNVIITCCSVRCNMLHCIIPCDVWHVWSSMIYCRKLSKTFFRQMYLRSHWISKRYRMQSYREFIWMCSEFLLEAWAQSIRGMNRVNHYWRMIFLSWNASLAKQLVGFKIDSCYFLLFYSSSTRLIRSLNALV